MTLKEFIDSLYMDLLVDPFVAIIYSHGIQSVVGSIIDSKILIAENILSRKYKGLRRELNNRTNQYVYVIYIE